MEHKITGIILAAGMGTRLGDITKEKPKALVEVAGKLLILYAISFLKQVGVENMIVVGGFHHRELEAKVRETDPSIKVLENKEYKKGNIYTLCTALPHVESGFLVMNTDHVYRRGIADRVREQFGNDIVAFTDNDRVLGDDDAKVKTSEDGLHLKKLSKRLTKFERGYVGMAYCSLEMLQTYKEAAERTKSVVGEQAYADDVLQVLADGGEDVLIGDISGYGWHEIDFPDELFKAEAAINADKKAYFC